MTPEPPTRLQLEQWALETLPPDEVASLEARALEDPDLASRMERIRADIDASVIDLPPLPPLPADPVPWWRRRWMPAVGLVLAAVAALVVLVPASDPGVTFRGAFDLEITRVRAGQAEDMGLVVDAQDGDRLQYTVTAPEGGYLYVYDVQDDGLVSEWTAEELFPMQSETFAVILDDYAGSERVFFLVADAPLEADLFETIVGDIWRTPLADLDTVPGLPDDVDQRSILIVRENP